MESYEVKLSVDHHRAIGWLVDQWGEKNSPRGYPFWWVIEP